MLYSIYSGNIGIEGCLKGFPEQILRKKNWKEPGYFFEYDIRPIQELLGQSNMKTTLINTHVSKKEKAKIKSPLSKLNLNKMYTS